MKIRLEVRNDSKGKLDEICLWARMFPWSKERAIFHLERLDTNAWWAGIYGDNESWHLNFKDLIAEED